MALKVALILILLPLLGEALSSVGTNNKASPFEFLENLKGCQKGKSLKGIHGLKQYLKRFGYLNYDHSDSDNNTHADDDDDFDEHLESALKTYQLNYHLNCTGTLDAETVQKMTMPRCGVPDIINGTTAMRSGKRKHKHSSKSLHTTSHYSFFPGSPRWPDFKTHLTYAIDPISRVVLSPILGRAFTRWSLVTHFTFEEILDVTVADITIAAHSGDHGDGYPFDGPSGTLAHAFSPTVGVYHIDADENWSNGPILGYFDLETVSLHEIGHLLGLEHSSVEDAIMYPSIPDGISKDLHGDDVMGIKALYNVL